MKLNNRKAIAAIVAATLLCACSNEKTYTITGTLDLPDQIPYGDTIIDVPSLDYTWVYLFDFDNELVDSTQIENNEFKFEGKVKTDDTHFLQLVCQAGSSLIAIEPGDIEVYISPDITVTGTPSNDAMTDLDAALANLNNDTYTYLAELTDSLRNVGEELSDSLAKEIADSFRGTMYSILEDSYKSNENNLAGVYAVLMRHSDVTSSEEFEKALADYPEKIRNSELIKLNLRLLRQYEQMEMGNGLDDLDPSMFAPAEEGMPQNP